MQSVDGNITVVAPFEGTPAHRLGIRAGDVISRIEEQDARGLSIDDAVKRLRGPKGTPVRITILRQGYDQPLEFTVIRDSIPLHSVPYFFMASKSVGYVRLTDFNETTACRPGEGDGCERELEKAIRALQKSGATSILLDIRDNPGRPPRPGVRGVEPLPQEGPARRVHARAHEARRVELHHGDGHALRRTSPSSS